MSKFFYISRSDLEQLIELFHNKNPNKYVLLSKNNRFADIVRYNSKYDTLVFLTVPVSKL